MIVQDNRSSEKANQGQNQVADSKFTWNDPWIPPQPHSNRTTGGWPKKQPRSAWPKYSDMKPSPIDPSEDGGISFRSNSNGDPNYDVRQLMDFEGNWMPPPEVWVGRNSFRDRHFGDTIEKWAEGAEAAGCKDITMNIDPDMFNANINSDMAPRLWVPTQIEGDAPQDFWRTFPSRDPAPLSDVDLTDLKPWWENYRDGTTSYMSPVEVPLAKVDTAEEVNQQPGVTRTSNLAVRKMNEISEERTRRIIAKRNRPVKVIPIPEGPDMSLKPTANIYLRPVQPADISGIMEIYNYYVRESIVTTEFNDRLPTHIGTRVQDIKEEGLPWIVAVERGNHTKNRHHEFVNEHIIGFASIDDHCDKGSMYRYSFEMELYVHPEYLRKGVGKCLLDKMLDLVDNGYRARGGYEWACEGSYLRNGCTRVAKNVIITYPHEQGLVTEVDWIAKFLKSFDFRKSGHLRSMGYKLGKV